MTKWSFQVPGNPEPWQVQIRNAARTDGYERRVAWQGQIRAAARRYWCGEQGMSPAFGLVSLSFAFYRPWPPRAPKRNRDPGMRWCRKHVAMKPDLTNYIKACEDALRGIIFVDDNQVASVQASKDYADGPEGYTVIWIEEI